MVPLWGGMSFPVESFGSQSFRIRIALVANVTVLGLEHRVAWFNLHEQIHQHGWRWQVSRV